MDWERLEKLLDELLDLTGPARAARLEAVERLEPELAQRARQALAGPDDGPSLAALGALADAIAPAGPAATDEPPPPAAFGPWRRIERIASGGMGDVFLVCRADGQYEARAALKRLRPGVASPGLRERFVRERQLLAQLRHPHIATLLDGGVDAGGVPYLVLEYVDGAPITEHCDAERLTIAERLALFDQAAAAVTAAHQRLIVHRDLKPGNILVAREGGVKLLDFGIAKLLDDPAALDRTTTAERVLTPRYAAPEQILGGEVTTATDVYGLGVVLYELLSGCRPASDGALDRAVRSGAPPPDPPRLTAALRRVDAATLAAVAARRSATPRALERELSGDLEEIVAKALRPDPRERYPTAASLSDDLGRARRAESVEAHRGSTLYRARKFWLRHRLPVTAATAVVAALVVALAVSVAKTSAARLAERRAAAINRFLTDELLGAADPGRARGRDPTVREVVDRASRGVASAFVEEPGVEVSVRRTLATLLARVGDTRAAGEQLSAARRRLALRPEDRGERGRVARAAAELALAEGRFDDARHEIEAAVADLRATAGERASETIAARILAGRILIGDGDVLVAERDLQAIVGELDLEHPGEAPLRAAARVQLAAALKAQGRREEALATLLEAARLQEGALGGDHPDLAQTLEQMAHIYGWIGRHEEAEAAARRALEIDRNVFGSQHWRTLRGAGFLAEALLRAGRREAARQEAEAALSAAAPTLGDDHPEVAALRNTLANLALRSGDLATADAEYRAALAGAERSLGPGADLSMMIRRNFSNFLAAHGDRDESLRLARRVRELGLEAAAGPRPDPMELANVAWFLARAELPAARDLEAALGLAEQAVALSRGRWYYPWVALAEVRFRRSELEAAIEAELRAVALPDGLHLPGEDRFLVQLLTERGQLARAERFVREQLARRRTVRPADDPILGQTRALLGRVLLAAGRPAEAAVELRAAIAQLDRRLPTTHEARIPAWSDLGAALAATGHRGEAAEALREADRLAAAADGERAEEERATIAQRLAALGLSAAPATAPPGGGEATPGP